MTVLIVAGALLLVFFSVGWYFFRRACARVPDLPWLDREAILKTNYAPHADLIQRSHKWLLDHGATDVWTQSEDGLRLHGLWVEAEEAIGTAILVHGYHSTKLVDFGGSMAYLHRQGLNLLLVDQRAHGESGGHTIAFGVEERLDCLDWLKYAVGRFGCDTPMALYGVSMGAATVLMASGLGLPENVKCIVADCPYSSPRAIISKVCRDMRLPPGRHTGW